MGNLTKAQLKRQRSDKISDLSALKKRRDQVQAVINSIDGSFSDDVDKINKKITSSANDLGSLKGVSAVSTARSNLTAKKEKYNDGKLSDCRNALVAERRRLNTKIDSLNGEINRLKYKIDNLDD